MLIIAQAMDKEMSGSAFLLVAAFNIASILGRFGLGNVMLRYLAVTDPPNGKVFRQVLCVSCVAAVLTTFFCLIVLKTGKFESLVPTSSIAVPFGLASIIAAITLINAYSLRALGHTNLSIWMQSGALPFGVFIFCAIIFAFTGGLTVLQVAIGYLVSTLTNFLWIVSVPRLKSLLRAPGRSDPQLFKKFLNEARPLAIMEFMQIATQWLPVLILAQIATLSDVADYHVASRIAFLATFILFGVTAVVAPNLAKLHAAGRMKELSQLYRRSAAISMVAGGLPLTILFVFPSIVLEIFGHTYQSGVWVLRVLVVGQIINMVSGPVMTLLVMTGNQRAARNAGILGGCLALVVAFGLSLHLGALGVAIGVSLSVIAQNLLGMFYAKKYLRISLLGK